VAKAHNVHDVLVIADSIFGNRLRTIINECRQSDIEVKMVPRIDTLLNGNVRPQIRDVDINDLLRREIVHLDSLAIAEMLEGRRVMVTGAGGSIGAEICRQTVRRRPECLILVERSEHALFQIDRELRPCADGVTVAACLADVRDRKRMEMIFRQHRPQIIFHAAAHKHVPLLENNPGEAIKNNVFGTMALVEMADKYGARRFVMISTDKAVRPSSVMGVSKQLAERYVHAFSEVSKTRFVVVRFGNVLGSSGSVIPIFREQIRRGGPITVTHPEMRRFFMTIPEASQLVLEAAAMGNGGEIFVLNMGEPIRVAELARELVRLSGLTPDDIEIVFTGLRPGEKLFEDLYAEDERLVPTAHPKVRAARCLPSSLSQVRQAIFDLEALLHTSESILREKLQEVVSDYSRSVPPAEVASPEPLPLVQTEREPFVKESA